MPAHDRWTRVVAWVMTRIVILGWGLLLAAPGAVAQVQTGGRSGPLGPPGEPGGSNGPIGRTLPEDALVQHVLDRLTYGQDTPSLARIRQLGVDDWIREQLRPAAIPESPSLLAKLAQLPPAYTQYGDPLWHWEQLFADHLLRAVYTDRQLNEVLTEFWHNHFNTVAPGAKDGAVGLFPSIALDPMDRPIVAHFAQSITLGLVAHWQGSWALLPYDGDHPTGLFPSIAIDPQSGQPTIAGYQPNWGGRALGDLRFSRFDGTSWSVEPVDTEGDVGAWASLAYDSTGAAAIAYEDRTNGELKLARFDGTDWLTESITSGGLFASLGFTSDDRPCIGHYDPVRGAIVVSRWTGSSWDTSIVAPLLPADLPDGVALKDQESVPARILSLAIDPATDQPAVAYQDVATEDLRLARFDGTRWTSEAVDTLMRVGLYPSLQFDPVGRPGIAYHNATTSHLRYAHWDGSTWRRETVGPLDQVTGLWSQLVYDSLGNPRIAYYDGSYFNLHLASWNGSNWQLQLVHGNSNYFLYIHTAWAAEEMARYRAGALGCFRDLLQMSATSPAMMVYLNNDQNTAGAGNENYARELLELHTLGVDGGYTQADVEEVAKAFTGWSVDYATTRCDLELNGFCYNRFGHDGRPRTVLGVTFPDDSGADPSNWMRQGNAILDMLASHPSTASFVCGKLIEKLVDDVPPVPLLERCIDTFLGSGGEIRDVVETLLFSPEFREPARFAGKVRTPLEYVVATVRTLEGDTDGISLYDTLLDQGLPAFWVAPPTGYEEVGISWTSPNVLLNRWRFADRLLHGMDGSAVDPVALARAASVDRADAIIELFARRLLRSRLGPAERVTLLEFLNLGDPGPIDLDDPAVQTRLRDTVELMLGLPEFHKQ